MKTDQLEAMGWLEPDEITRSKTKGILPVLSTIFFISSSVICCNLSMLSNPSEEARKGAKIRFATLKLGLTLTLDEYVQKVDKL